MCFNIFDGCGKLQGTAKKQLISFGQGSWVPNFQL